MHMRGTPQTMTSDPNLVYERGVLRDVASELGARVRAATAAGVAPWRLVVDPGVGFAKTTAHNLDILRHLPTLKRDLGGLPLLYGPSRKRFLGDLVHEPEPTKRDAATAGACCAAVPAADLVRVHDVRTVAHALKVADAARRF